MAEHDPATTAFDTPYMRSAGDDGMRTREASLTALERELTAREEVLRAREVAVSERQAATEQVRQANEQLVFATLRAEKAVAEAREARAAAEHARAEAQQDRAALEAEAELREQLMAVVGHDLRNPLASILMAAQLLLRTNQLQGRQAEILSGVEHSAARMRDLIEQLLEFTRAQQGAGLPIHPRGADLEQICLCVVRELELGRNAPGRFACHFQGNMTGNWDASRLAQVISNIAGNALQHGSGDSKVTLDAVGTDDSVQLKIHNQGPPIPPALVPAIFEPFRRGHEASPSGGSLGLGLYIAAALIRSHHGSIAVRSTWEEGTTFAITLPRDAGTG